MTRDLLIITSLACEAAPLIKAWALKPLRENALAERFQVFCNDRIYVAVSGIGKVRSAICTAALTSGLFSDELQPILANVGIAGAAPDAIALGSLVYINKVRDVATNSRLYPDIVLKHNLPEMTLDTHDHPVTNHLNPTVVVDMEGSGFIQAALSLTPPSHTCLLKVISDFCRGEAMTPTRASAYINDRVDDIFKTLTQLSTDLPHPQGLSTDESRLLIRAATHVSLSLSQRIELTRRLRFLKAQGIQISNLLEEVSTTAISTKEERNSYFRSLIQRLSASVNL